MDFQISSPFLFSSLVVLFLSFLLALRGFEFRFNLFTTFSGLSLFFWLFLISEFSLNSESFILILLSILPTLSTSLLFIALKKVREKKENPTNQRSEWIEKYMFSKIILFCFFVLLFVFIPFSLFQLDVDFLNEIIYLIIFASFIFSFFDCLILSTLFYKDIFRLFSKQTVSLKKKLQLILNLSFLAFTFFVLSIISKTFFISFEFSLSDLFFQKNSLSFLLPGLSLGIFTLTAILAHEKTFLSFKVSLSQFLGASIMVLSSISLVNSTNLENFILRLILFVILSFLSYFLVKSVISEIQNKRDLQKTGKQIFQANKSLRGLDKAKSTFISSASHQLRSPLSVIKGISALLLEGSYGQLSPSHKDALTKIYISNERLIGLIEDLLDISHLEEGKVEFTFAKKDINEIAKKAVMGLNLQAKNKKLYLKFKPSKTPLLAWVDESKITEVISNLIDNAIKYTRRGGVSVEVKKAQKTALVVVRDTGIGLKKSEIHHLFERFVRAGRGKKLSTVGTGLGLYVAKKMTLAQKAKIWVESNGEGKGSTFFIEFKLDLASPPDERFIQAILKEKNKNLSLE